MANGDTTRVVNLKLDANQFNRAIQGVESNTAKLNKQVGQTNKQLDNMSKEFSRATGFSKELNRAINSLRNVFAAVFAFRIAEGFISDLQATENQIRTVTTSLEEFISVQEDLSRVAEETRQSYDATAKLYARIARANDELGLSQQQIVTITENVNKALAAQGASAQEARSVLLQLSQAFGSGRLAGEEFRAVAEGAPLILQDIAAALTRMNGGMEVTVGQLKQMAADGEITGDVLAEAMQNAERSMKAFETTLPTLGQSLQVLFDKFQHLVRDANQTVPLLAAMAEGVLWLADNLDLLAIALAVFTTYKFGNLLVAWTASLWGMASAALGATLSVRGLGQALIFVQSAWFPAAVLLAGAAAWVAIKRAIDDATDAFGSFGLAIESFGLIWSQTVLSILNDIPVISQALNAIAVGIDLAFGGQGLDIEDRLAEIDKRLEKMLEDNTERIRKRLQQEADTGSGGGSRGLSKEQQDEQDRLKKLADGIVSDLRSAAEVYADAEADIAAALELGFIDALDAQAYLAGLRAELDPTSKAASDFAQIMGDMARQVTAVNLGMSQQEYEFRLAAAAAGNNAEEVNALWGVYSAWLKQVEDAEEALKKEKEAQDALTASRKEWADLLNDTLTPQQQFIKRLQEVETLARKVGATDEELARVLTNLSQEYYDASDAARALAQAEEDLILQSNELRSRFDNRQIIADFQAQESILQQMLDKRLIDAEVYNKALVEIDNEKNMRLIENGTNTMQILSAVSEDFVSGFGDAMLDFAKGSEDAFEDFATSFIDNVAQMVIQLLILEPLLENINRLISGMGTGGTVPVSAGAGAGGGSVGQLRMASVGIGPSGSSGPTANAARAVVSATRTISNTNAAGVTRGGSSQTGGGSNVVVNVNNETPAEIDVRQRQTSDGTEIEVLVTNAVRQGIMSGRMDDVMANTYGIQRRGS